MDWQFRGADFRKFNTETLKHILNALEAFSDPYTIYIYIYIYVCMVFFGHAAWLVGSQLPNQRLNLGHSSESPKP